MNIILEYSLLGLIFVIGFGYLIFHILSNIGEWISDLFGIMILFIIIICMICIW